MIIHKFFYSSIILLKLITVFETAPVRTPATGIIARGRVSSQFYPPAGPVTITCSLIFAVIGKTQVFAYFAHVRLSNRRKIHVYLTEISAKSAGLKHKFCKLKTKHRFRAALECVL